MLREFTIQRHLHVYNGWAAEFAGPTTRLVPLFHQGQQYARGHEDEESPQA